MKYHNSRHTVNMYTCRQWTCSGNIWAVTENKEETQSNIKWLQIKIPSPERIGHLVNCREQTYNFFCTERSLRHQPTLLPV